MNSTALCAANDFSHVSSTFAWPFTAKNNDDDNDNYSHCVRHLSCHLRQWASFDAIFHDDDATTIIRLIGSLPATGDPVYVLAQCPSCDHALPVNSMTNVMIKATEDWIHTQLNNTSGNLSCRVKANGTTPKQRKHDNFRKLSRSLSIQIYMHVLFVYI
jgi:hypothetical protein